MLKKKLPQKPTNLRPYSYSAIINKRWFTKLEVSPYYEKHNQEYLEALRKRGIKLTPKLTEKLITDDLIRKLAQKLDGEKVDSEGRYYYWTYYSFRVYWGVKAYRLVWCVADNEPHILGIMDCYRQSRFDKDN
ncbi:hypothetical protein [endosymbiont GvMRE of Glomus versiforme]|uniref:hypothetical protein n=1 Tax=endosymbiont GvMRE of Glomus versiforme TaxID=2039283 RepID=UPI000EC6F288|nr:hypothetical protein [endosymbiont GvMRE of Glomus versiforme]RHZ36379.1 hypothetical protein GvMRE_Ic1g216 [endosymbiont GvMRE of Glomus versiforme]RHZ36381.1 hypothetical protein GvMRE_Ic1g214 [endosymbiont GvMRE of Glomus versiforme]